MSPPRASCLVLGACAALVSANLMPFTLRYTADPAPFVVTEADGSERIYISTSHDLWNQTDYTMYDYSAISSTDLVNWRDEGIIFDARTVNWGPVINGKVTPGAWAQQIIGPSAGASCPSDTCHYMYWPNVFEHSNITGSGTGVAVSTTGPAGPYVDITPNGKFLIAGDDPTVFRDPDDGSVYLCGNPVGGYAPGTTAAPVCGKLAADMVTFDVPPVGLTGVPHFFEAPWLQKMGSGADAPWLMSYMCPARNEITPGVGHYGRDLCQTVCTPNATNACPLGEYAFVEANRLQWNPPYDCDQPFGCAAPVGWKGAGDNTHHGLVRFHGRWVMAYHTRLLAASRGLPSAGLQRNMAIDAAYVDPTSGNASFLPVTATPSWLRPLAGVRGRTPTVRLCRARSPRAPVTAWTRRLSTTPAPQASAGPWCSPGA